MEDYPENNLESLVEKGLIDNKKTFLEDSLKGTACYMSMPFLLGSSFYLATKATSISENFSDVPTIGAALTLGCMATSGITAITALLLPKLASYFLTPPTERVKWGEKHGVPEGSREGKVYNWLNQRTAQKCKIY